MTLPEIPKIKPGKHLSREERKDLVEQLKLHYDNGVSLQRLSEAVGRSLTSIRSDFAENNVEVRPSGGRKTVKLGLTKNSPLPRLKPGESPAAEDRRVLAQLLKAHYESGADMHHLAGTICRGRDYVHMLLSEAETTMRPSDKRPRLVRQMENVAVNKAIGEELKKVRVNLGWTRRQLTERTRLTITVKCLRRYETGDTSCPLPNIIELCQTMNVSPMALIAAAFQSMGIAP